MLELKNYDCVKLVGKIVLAGNPEKVLFWRGCGNGRIGLVLPRSVGEIFAEMDTLLGTGLTVQLKKLSKNGKVSSKEYLFPREMFLSAAANFPSWSPMEFLSFIYDKKLTL